MGGRGQVDIVELVRPAGPDRPAAGEGQEGGAGIEGEDRLVLADPLPEDCHERASRVEGNGGTTEDDQAGGTAQDVEGCFVTGVDHRQMPTGRLGDGFDQARWRFRVELDEQDVRGIGHAQSASR